MLALVALTACPSQRPAISERTSRDAVVWQYDVSAKPGAVDDLSVLARFAAAPQGWLRLDQAAAPFAHDVAYASTKGWIPVERRGSAWAIPCSHGCQVRYGYSLDEAARTLADPETALASGGVVVAPPATWLLRPDADAGRFRLRVAIGPPQRFATAMRGSPGGPGTFEAAASELEDSSFAVFGTFGLDRLENGTMRTSIAIAPHGLGLSDADVLQWIKRAVDGLLAYYRRPFVDRVLVIVLAGAPGSPTRGETMGDAGPAVLVRAASGLTAAHTRDDWVVTHELIHVSLPALGHEHAWLSEGIATYVEPIVRARAGLVPVETFWRDLVEGLPQGLPGPQDAGLEGTADWGRVYWGGALFCLAADVAIRERTANTRSLDDALRGIVASGADVETHWTVGQFLEAADRATGTNVLADLYREMALAPGTVDLPRMWQRLGVGVQEGRVRLDDQAPLAAIRRAITER
jgi:hypothetical protein